MCFIVHEDHLDQKIADVDIICYKVLQKRFPPFGLGFYIAPSRKTNYRFPVGRIFEARDKYGNILSSFILPDDVKSGTEIYEGLHSHSREVPLYDIYEVSLFKCVIPKGTPYFYNPADGEYVSLKLKFIKKIK